jgi:hypothetical protein
MMVWDGVNIGNVLSPHDVSLLETVKTGKKKRDDLLLLCITVLLAASRRRTKGGEDQEVESWR